MFCVHRLLAGMILILLLLSPAAYALATPDQAAAGKVRGFTGPRDQQPNGDYLTATFCYCEYPDAESRDVMGPAHFYQFEYYNKHHDTTFVLTSACPDGDIGFERRCVPEEGTLHPLAGSTMARTCKLWEGWEKVGEYESRQKRTDEVCYIPNHKHGNDYLFYNGQFRNLGRKGGQGPEFRQDEGTEEICENMCRTNMDMGINRDTVFPPSHQVIWVDLDDMCRKCKAFS